MPGVSPKCLKHLPIVKKANKECGTIWLSGVRCKKDVKWACEVARALLPKEG